MITKQSCHKGPLSAETDTKTSLTIQQKCSGGTDQLLITLEGMVIDNLMEYSMGYRLTLVNMTIIEKVYKQ